MFFVFFKPKGADRNDNFEKKNSILVVVVVVLCLTGMIVELLLVEAFIAIVQLLSLYIQL